MPDESLLPGANDNHGSSILTVTGVLTGFSCVVVLARIYVRSILLKTVGADDYVMLIAMYALT